MRTSRHTPIEHSRTYTSANITETRLIHAHSGCRRFSALHPLYIARHVGDSEMQSLRPPTTCRSEWQPNVYPASSTTLTVSTRVPTPTPNPSANQKDLIASH